MFIVVSTKPPVTTMVRLVVELSAGRIVAVWNCVGGAVASMIAVEAGVPPTASPFVQLAGGIGRRDLPAPQERAVVVERGHASRPCASPASAPERGASSARETSSFFTVGIVACSGEPIQSMPPATAMPSANAAAAWYTPGVKPAITVRVAE